MKKIIIIIPIFNDWESLKQLLLEIDQVIKEIEGILVDCLVINDASTMKTPEINKPKNIKSLKILNMKQNKGHAKCNAFGIRYSIQKEKFDFLILMDGDGEDRPIELRSLIDKAKNDPNLSVVAKRVKRSEGIFFKTLYLMHKIITYIFTGKIINFGNYSCLTINDAKIIQDKASLWNSYSGTIKKYLLDYNEIDSTRGKRFFGPSKMSFFNLIIHSFSIIAVFKYQVLWRSIALLLILYPLSFFSPVITIFAQVILIVFNFIIIFISFREKKDELLRSHENLKDINLIIH
tara:strand:- start:2782 stop:3654 length:873 start_codon:yes stop_codon:yes gene_type:complete